MAQASGGEFAVERNAPHPNTRAGYAGVARAIVAFCVFEATFYIAYRNGMSFSQLTASPFWLPDSVLLCALLLTPARWWWVFLLGALPIRLAIPEAAEMPQWFLLYTFVIDSAKAAIMALALRHFLSDPLQLRSVRDFALYCLITVLLVPTLAAFAGAAGRFLLGYDYWRSWQQWFLGNALTHLVVTPAIIYGIPGAARQLASASKRRLTEALLVAVGLIVTGYLAFQIPPGARGFAEPWFYAPVPFLFWAALRFGMFGASFAVVIISVISVDAALHGRGPFAGGSPNETALALQQFLMLRAAPLYLVAILCEQKQAAEHRLVTSERRYREVVESQTELVCRFLTDGRLSFVNDAFCRAYQRKRELLVGADFMALLPANVREVAWAQAERAALYRERGEWECQVTRPEGGVAWQHWLCRPVTGGGAVDEEFQAIGHDVTDRKRAEEADRTLTHASRLAVVGELTAMVAHEINQPLGAILSNAEAAEMLLDSPDPPLGEIRRILSDIRGNDLRASQAILRIRALTRKREMNFQPIDLNAAIADVLRLMSADLLRRKVQARSEVDSSIPLVSGDWVHLQQVLLNLFVNAIDAMQDVSVPRRLLCVRTCRQGSEMVEVVVSDRGHGIAPEQLSGIFESFCTTKADGMGLGLSIARSIVKAHRGRIWAENLPDGGAAFHFTVKIVQGEVE